MADDRQVNEVIINGETVVNLRKDTVAENNLMEEETATNHEGRKIEGEFNGASEDEAYLISDPIGDIEEEDYVPFNDVSDTEIPKKKTLFSEFIGKLADFFISKRGTNGNYTIDNDSQTMYMKHNKIDASKVDNNVTSITYPSLSNILDKDGRIIMRTEAVVMPDGKIGWKAYVNNYDTSGTRIAQRGLKFYEDKTGAMTFEVDDPRAFRKAVDSIDQLGASLPRNTVIDDYHTDSYTGTYYFADDSVASTIVTLPEAVCGKLIVTNNGNGGFSQYYIPNHSVKIWVRVWWSNAWSAWQDLASGSKPHTYDIGTKIPQNSDLNTYITCGTYHVAGNADAETISNLPYPCAGKLLVLTINNDSSNNPRLYQLYFSVFNSYIYSRFRDFAGAWTAWEQIVNTESVHLLSEPDLSHSITANQDLNNFTQSGTWQCRLASTASTLSNCPVSVPFKLVVDRQYSDSKSELTQRITCLNSINLQGGEWYRTKTYNVSTWGEWIHVVFASNNVNGNKNGLQIYPTVSNGTRGVLKWNDADDTHLNHNFYNGTEWVGSKTLANIDDIVYYTLGITIPDNADLNDYTTNGIYNVSSNQKAATISNMPCELAGKLVVQKVSGNQYIKQIFFTYDSTFTYQGFYERTYNGDSGAWREWRKFVESNDGKIELYQETTTAEDKYVGISAKILDTTTAKSYSRDILKIYQDHQSIPYGFNLLLEGGGSTIIGSGEAASSHYNVLSKPLINEDLYITADGIIILQAKGNTINERKGFRITTNQELLPCIADVATNGVGSIGSSDYKLANIYTERINGSVPPTSDELNTAIAKVGKSILPSWSYASNVRTSNGITYTFNPTTGEITANGTATADSSCGIAGVGLSQYTILKGTYTLSGCPSGGNANKYFLALNLYDVTKYDYGEGNTFTLTSDHVCDDNQHLFIRVVSGVTVSNLVFRPMLRPAYASDTYEPCEDIHKGNCYVGTCTTAANQQVKVAYVDGFFNLRKGVRVAIKYTNSNTYNATASAPCKLNVNNTGDKQIYYYNTSTPTGTNNNAFGAASKYVYYIYDGTYWVWDGHGVDSNTDIRPSAYCDTASATAAKVASCTEYQLLSNSYLHILMRYSNTSASAITLNVNNKGAKPIYINGTASSNSNYTLPAGTYIVFYDGTNYYFRTDGNIMTNDNLRFFKQQSNLFFNTSYVSDTSGNYGLNIAPVADKNDRAQLKVSGTYQSALFYNYCINGTWKGDGLIFNKWFPNIVYCTSSTEAGTAAKVATSQGGGKLVILLVGMVACVVHSNNNTASNCTLNIDGTGAKQIYYNQGVYTGTSDIVCGRQNMAIFYMYDGTYWRWLAHGRNDNSTNFLRNDASSTLTASGSPYIDIKSSTIDLKQANNGVESTQYPAYIIQDKNGYTMSRLECVVETDGGVSTYLQVRNYKSDGTNPNAGIKVKMDKNGTLQYFISQSNKFNAAIGIGYGTCTTAADQRVKIVNITDYVITTGGIIGVKFSNTNTYSATADNKICLNVNGTGEKPIYYNTGYPTGTNTTAFGIANRVHYYMYDGTNWCWLNSGCEDNTVDPRQLGSGYGTCDTAAATAAKVVTMSSYALRTGGILSVKFTNAVPANATMNINSRGAKSIYYRGSAIPANIIRAGDRCLFVYNGSQYDLLSVDRDSIEKNNVIAWSDIAFGTNVPSMSSANSNVWGDIRSNLLLANMRFSTSASGTIPANNSSSGGFFRISKFAPYTWRMVHVTYGNTYVPAYLDNITYNGTSGLMVVLRNSLSVAQNADICVSFEVELE